MKKSLFSIVLLIALFISQNALAAQKVKKAGLGFEFGTTFQFFQKSNFKNGGANYFRLNMNNANSGKYFLHKENGNVSAEVGDATSTLTVNVIGVGSIISLGNDLELNLMVGNATVNGVAATGTGTNAITAIQSTSPMADIGVSWEKKDGSTSLNLGTAYRYHTLSNPITFTDSTGKTDRITDMSSFNINLGISYSF